MGTAEPTPANQEVSSAVAAYLQSVDAAKLIEGKILEYALERKAEEVFRQFLRSRVSAFFASVFLVVGYLGWDINERIKVASESLGQRAGELEKLSESVSRAKADVEAGRAQLLVLRNDAVAEQLRLAGQLNVLAERTDRQMLDATNKLFSYATSSADKLARADSAVASANAAAERTASRMQRLQNDLEDQINVANELKERLRLQARLINTAVLEVVSINDKTTSGPIELQRLRGDPSKLYFLAANITKATDNVPYVDLVVRVDGVDEKPLRVEAAADGQWRHWRRLPGNASDYEFRIDHIYYDEKANDFITVQVRATREFAQSLIAAGGGASSSVK